MNILPKKRWHVRTKENIARVRRDEAQAAEKERIGQERSKLAESEARRQLLLEKSRKKFKSETFIPLSSEAKISTSETHYHSKNEHVNLFREVEEGIAELKHTNKEHDEELKQEREKYEKQIGYLTYLGQDTNEALGKKSWYELAPNKTCNEKGELNLKSKVREDPLIIIKKFADSGKKIESTYKSQNKYESYKSLLHQNHKETKRCKKRKKSRDSSEERYIKKRKKDKRAKYHNYFSNSPTSDGKFNPEASNKHETNFDVSNSFLEELSSDEQEKLQKAEKKKKLEVLREQRLKREKEERRRSEGLLSKIKTGNAKEKPQDNRGIATQKYNSQFNPELAKQNYF